MMFERALSTVAVVVVLILAGCAAVPRPEQMAAADYGPEPVNYEAAIHRHLHSALKDPESVRDLRIAPPMKGFFQYDGHSSIEYGWLSVVELNARNSFGGYAGLTAYLALLRDGNVTQFVELRYTSQKTGYWGAFGQGKHFYGYADDERK